MWQALLTWLAHALCGCSHAGVYIPRQQPEVPQAAGIEVLFNQRRGQTYTSPLTGKKRKGDNLEQALIEAIASARSEVLVAVQELTLPRIAQALIERHQAGVKVRVVLEHQYRQPWSLQHPAGLEPHAQQRLRRLKRLGHEDAIRLLDVAGVPVIDDTADGSSGSGLMHHKFVVIDQQVVLTTSANFTSSGIHGDGDAGQTRGNVNHLLRINSEKLAEFFKAEFAQLWGDGPESERNSRFGLQKDNGRAQTLVLNQQQVSVLFPPHRRKPNQRTDTDQAETQKCQRQHYLALFVFSAQELADVLAQKQAEGVAIRALIDQSFAYRSYSELLDLLGQQLPDHRCMIEKGNKP